MFIYILEPTALSTLNAYYNKMLNSHHILRI